MLQGLRTKNDIRKLPAYGIGEAAHYLRIPKTTLRYWVLGQHYKIGTGKTFAKPIINPADEGNHILSFMNLIEAHVLDAIRREHEISLQKVRKALDYLSKHFRSGYPLVDQRFETDGLDLFIPYYGQLISLTKDGQMAMRKLLLAHLRRIERDPQGIPTRLFPFTRKRDPEEPKAVVIDPYISFGRPVLVGTGITTAIVAERYKAGESMEALSEDYGCEQLKIEEAIRCELELEAA